MPNGWEPPVLSLAPRFIPVRPIRFDFMFARGADGKCRLRYDVDGWRMIVECQRKDWKSRLKKVLEADGDDQDCRAAEKLLRTEL